MKYLSVCSGIEAATVAWSPLGWGPLAFSEFDKFPSAALDHHYPGVTNHGDMTKYKEWPDYEPNVLVGGTPCQSFSVAGLRKGLDDPRGNLMLTYLAIAGRYKPPWLVWENVPGVLSSNKGRDFGTFLSGLAELGYGFAYRILDAQFFGLAQRRRRVFVVGYLGSWQRAAAVLFEQASVSGHPKPSREKREEVTPPVASCLGTEVPGARLRCDNSDNYIVIPLNTMTMQGRPSDDKSPRMGSGIGKDGGPAPTLSKAHHHAIAVRTANTTANGHGISENVTHTLDGANGQAVCFEPGIAKRDGAESRFSKNISPTLRSAMGDNQPAVCFAQNTRDEVREMKVSGALAAQPGTKQQSYLRQNMQVRRLTPRECERLQGFPDDYTKIPWRDKPAEQCPDSPRYKALGNSMAVPVMRWIGQRIKEVSSVN